MSIEQHFGLPSPIPIHQSATARAGQQSRMLVEARRIVLAKAVHAFVSQAFGEMKMVFRNWDGFVRILDTSLQEQFLQTVTIRGLRKGVIRCSLSVRVDWEKHALYDENDELISLDPSRSLPSQISEKASMMIDFFRHRAMTLEVDSLCSYWTWTPSSIEEEKRRDLQAGVGTPTAEDGNAWKSFVKQSKGQAVVPGKLKELKIAYRISNDQA